MGFALEELRNSTSGSLSSIWPANHQTLKATGRREAAPLLDERTYYRLVLDELLVLEVFRVPSGAW